MRDHQHWSSCNVNSENWHSHTLKSRKSARIWSNMNCVSGACSHSAMALQAQTYLYQINISALFLAAQTPLSESCMFICCISDITMFILVISVFYVVVDTFSFKHLTILPAHKFALVLMKTHMHTQIQAIKETGLFPVRKKSIPRARVAPGEVTSTLTQSPSCSRTTIFISILNVGDIANHLRFLHCPQDRLSESQRQSGSKQKAYYDLWCILQINFLKKQSDLKTS